MTTPQSTQFDVESHDAAESNNNCTLDTRVHNLYEPLDKEKRQIRLFELLPGKKGDSLRGQLHTVALEDNPRFDALSYVWGDAKARFPLTCNENKTLMALNTLRPILTTLRLEDESVIVWIDAICINQDDVRERGHQVRLMQAIYTMAQCVRIWLNTDVDPSSPAFSAALRLKGPHYDWSSGKYVKRKLKREIQLQDRDPEFWRPLYEVHENEYWERVWTQQELYLAREIQIHTPRGLLSKETVLNFESSLTLEYYAVSREPDYTIRDKLKLTRMFGKSLFPSICMGYLLLEQQHTTSNEDNYDDTSLFRLYLRSGALKTTDPRDRVYGILGLSRNCSEADILADYTLSKYGVYAQVIEHFISKDKSLNFLCNSASEYDNSFPSWLPTPEKGSCILFKHLSHINTTNLAMESYATITNKVLSAQGIRFDLVTAAENEISVFTNIPLWWNGLQNLCIKSGICEKTSEVIACEQVYELLTFGYSDAAFKTKLPVHSDFRRGLTSLVTLPQRRGYKELSISSVTSKHNIEPDEAELRTASFIHSAVGDGFFFGTQNKRIGAAHPSYVKTKAEPGDEVWILLGCKMPIILRSAPNGKYKVIGPAVIPGLMEGEACEGLLENGVPGPDYRGPPVVKVDLI